MRARSGAGGGVSLPVKHDRAERVFEFTYRLSSAGPSRKLRNVGTYGAFTTGRVA